MIDKPFPILYDCDDCKAEGRLVFVRFRHANEEIKRWMQAVCIGAIAVDHAVKSPNCRAKTISRTIIPVKPGAKEVGKELDEESRAKMVKREGRRCDLPARREDGR